MSAIKLEQPIYYGPGYHTHRTIIVDEQIESPETLTIRLEEEAVRGGLNGDSPTGLLPMSAYKPQLQGYADSPYSPYSTQPFSTQQTENAASHLNQMAFAANNAASGQYLAAQTPPSINIISCHPRSGSHNTKVSLRATSQDDLGTSTMTAAPFVSILFGSQRCTAQVQKESQDGNGTYTYTITTEAPQFTSTSCPSLSDVPLTLLVEGSNGEVIARVNNAASFSYHSTQAGVGGGGGVSGSGDTSPPDLGSPKRSPVQRTSPPHQSLHMQPSTSSSSIHHGLTADATTNTYGFPPGVSTATTMAQVPAHSDYTSNSTGGYSQASSNMLGAFRNPSFTDPYPRAAPLLRSPPGAGWAPFDSVPRAATTIPHSIHASAGRPPNPLSAPPLERTSTLNQTRGAGGGHGGYPYPGVFQTIKAQVKFNGDLASMAQNWTQEEWGNKRRLVMFKKSQAGSLLNVSFSPVSAAERPTPSICISCIYWAEKNDCFVTSVDTIHLLEQLLSAPSTRFTVEEKNRIRRNLEGFHPSTVSKAKPESDAFFKVIMGFQNPKPRNIEKDVKVYHWKDLDRMLRKIIEKYSASMSSIESASNPSHLITPSVNSSYPLLPPTPTSTSSTGTSESTSASGYLSTNHHHHHQVDPVVASTRQLPGVSSWAAYGASGRTMSPAVKPESPVTSSNLRISTLTAYDSRGAMQNLTSPYSISSSAHHSPHHSQGGYSQPGVPVSHAHTRSWDNYSMADGYSTGGGHSHGQVYDGGAYGDGTQRA